MVPTPTPDPIYDQLEHRLAAWSAAQPGILAVIVIGSRARSTYPADALSDLDAIVFTVDPDSYTNSNGWRTGLEDALGLPIWFGVFDQINLGDPEWEFVLDGGRKVDLVFCGVQGGPETPLAAVIAASPYGAVFERGARVLFNRLPGDTPEFSPRLPAQVLPDQFEFDRRVNGVLLELVRAAKMTRRGEVWRAAYTLNHELQANLLALLEWQAYLHDAPAWDSGRFLEDWASGPARVILAETWANNTTAGIRRSIQASLDLLNLLGPEIAAALGLTYPAEPIRQTSAWLHENQTTRVIPGGRVGRQNRLRLGCSVVIFDPPRQKVLLTRRADNGLWCLPGGGMEPGETAETTCVREVYEETGLRVRVLRLIGVYSSPDWLIEYPDGSRVQTVALTFEAQPETGELRLNSEVAQFGFFSLDDITGMALMLNHKQRIQDAFSGQAQAYLR